MIGGCSTGSCGRSGPGRRAGPLRFLAVDLHPFPQVGPGRHVHSDAGRGAGRRGRNAPTSRPDAADAAAAAADHRRSTASSTNGATSSNAASTASNSAAASPPATTRPPRRTRPRSPLPRYCNGCRALKTLPRRLAAGSPTLTRRRSAIELTVLVDAWVCDKRLNQQISVLCRIISLRG